MVRGGVAMNALPLDLAGIAPASLSSPSPETVTFDTAETVKPPAGWTAGQTGSGQAKWAVVADATAPSKPNVLKQSGTATYPVCSKDGTSIKDGIVEEKVKPLSGNDHPAGGLLWRTNALNQY